MQHHVGGTGERVTAATTAPLRRIVGATRHGRTRSETPEWIGDTDAGALSELLECGHPGGAVIDMFTTVWRARVEAVDGDPWDHKPDARACWRCLTVGE